MNKTKNILCTIGIVFFTLIFLVPFVYTIRLSVVDYSPIRGLLGSPFIGYKHFVDFINSPYFTQLLSNTLTISILGTVIGAAYVFLASLSVGSIKNLFFKGILTVIFAIPAIIPVNLYAAVFSKEFLVSPSFLLQFSIAAVDGLRIAGLVVATAFFIKEDKLKESVKCTLLFVAIRLIFILSNDVTVTNMLYNNLTYEKLDVFSTFSYRTGLMSANFSFAAAVHIFKTALQYIPAAIACAIICLITKKRYANEVPSNISFSPISIIAVIPVLLLLVIIIKGGSLLPVVFHETVIIGYLNEFFISFASALFVTIISVLLAVIGRNAGIIGPIALVLLCLTGNDITGKYLLIRSFGLSDTFLGTICFNFNMISVFALIIYFATYHNRSIKKDISAFIIGFTLAFGWFWGDFASSMIVRHNRTAYPLSLVLREIIIMEDNTTSGIFLSTLPYILIPAVVVCVGFIIGTAIKKD